MGQKPELVNFWNDIHPEQQIRYYNHLAEFTLDQAGIDRLLQGAPVCTATWVARDGSPRSIALPYALLDDEHVYLTAEASQPLVRALRKDPRIALCWGGFGGAATVRGEAEVKDDRALTDRVREASAKQRYPSDPAKAEQLARRLDSPSRVTIKVRKGKFITFSSGNLPRD